MVRRCASLAYKNTLPSKQLDVYLLLPVKTTACAREGAGDGARLPLLCTVACFLPGIICY